MDLLADIDLAVEPEPTRKAKKEKWYQRHEPGWAPEADDVTLAPRALKDCNANQVPSVVYQLTPYLEAGQVGARLYYPGWGVLWQYRGTFIGHGNVVYYEVEALGRVDGCGIAVGSVWSAEASKFRRVA